MDTQRNEGQETMNDLVDRLRAMTRCEHDDLTTAGEAADEIEKLRAERRVMQGALLAIKAHTKYAHALSHMADLWRIANTALGDKE
jgi:hypothetical protein